MKTLLIVPPNVNVIEPFCSSPRAADFIKFIQGFPLGLGYLGAVLEKEGIEVKILDAQVSDLPIEDISRQIKDFRADVVGITTLTATIKTTVEIVKAVKRIDQNIYVVLGGPHAHFDSASLLKNFPIDFIVQGEGELILLELLKALERGGNVDDVKGLVYRNGGGIKTTLPGTPIQNLDQLPFPARHLVNFDQYFDYFTHDLRDAIQIMGSRGCPYRCTFCSSSHIHGSWRGRSPENILDEIEHLARAYPRMKSFSFLDDNFTLNRKRTLQLCKMIISHGLNKYPWDCLARVDLVDEELLDTMVRAGCVRIQYGIESGSPTILNNIGKKIDLDVAKKVISMTKSVGIEAHAFFMVGNPGETNETIKASIEKAFDLKPTFVNWFITQVYPGTRLASLQPVDNWVDYIYEPELTNPSIYTHPCVPTFNPAGFDREKLKEIIAGIMKKFFWYYLPVNFPRWLKKFIDYPTYSLWYIKRLLTS